MATSSTSSAYNLIPKTAAVSIATANPYRDGTGAVANVFDATGNGMRVDAVHLVGVGTVADGMIRLFIFDGTNTFLLREIAVTATTPSGTQAGWTGDYIPEIPLVLKAGQSLRASTEVANTFNVIAVCWSL